MNATIHPHARRDERGSAMVISLLVLMVLTMIGTLFLVQTNTETQISGHDMRSTQALYNSEAGCAEALARMSDMSDTANYIGQAQGAWTGDPGWGSYIVLANGNSTEDPDYAATASDGLDNNGDGNVDEQGESYPEVPTKQAGDDPIGYDWVKVHYKLNATSQVILYGDDDDDISTPPRENLADGAPVLIISADGAQGTARRTVEIEAVKIPFQIVKAAIYTESDDFDFNGTQFLVSGQDWDPETDSPIVGGTEVPGIATTGTPSNITASLSSQQQNNVEGDGSEPSVQDAPADMDLQALAQQFASLATIKLPSGTYSSVTWGDYDNYEIVYVSGDLHISGGGIGGGALVVDGNFDCSGQFVWYGLVLVLGQIDFTGGGSGIHLFGACLTEGGLNAQVVGGNADVKYSSEALSRLTQLSPYTISAWHEL
jgi:hypothetical protein